MSRNRFDTDQTGVTNITQNHLGKGDNCAGSVSQINVVNGVEMGEQTLSILSSIADDYGCTIAEAMAEATRLLEQVETFTNKHGKAKIVDESGSRTKKIRVKL